METIKKVLEFLYSEQGSCLGLGLLLGFVFGAIIGLFADDYPLVEFSMGGAIAMIIGVFPYAWLGAVLEDLLHIRLL